MIAEALLEGDIVELLTGRGGYALPNPYLDTPTEPIQVFAGIVASFGDNAKAMKSVLDGILTASKDPDYAWFSVYYLFDVIANAKLFGAGFDLQAFVNQVLANVRQQEKHLRTLKKWAGAQDPDGCWGIVDRLVGQIRKYHEDQNLKIVW